MTAALLMLTTFGVSCGGSSDTGQSLEATSGGDDVAPEFNYATDGPIVARLRVVAPETESMILRGTIPVPPGTVVNPETDTPLALISPGVAAAAITQVEVVSRYPDPADGADVVEIIGHVRRAHNVAPGTVVEYDVALGPVNPVEFALDSDVEALMQAPGALSLVTNDVFGNRYEADLLAKVRADDSLVETMRNGCVARELRVPEVLLPVSPEDSSTGTLPRMMGVNAFVKTFREQPFFALDLHIHNAFDGTDDSVEWDVAMNDLYFDALNLRLPQGWVVVQSFENPFTGPAMDAGNMQEFGIVSDQGNGKMHLMHRQSQFSRRLVIAKEEALDDAMIELDRGNLGFCVDGENQEGQRLWSWWNPETARFMASNRPLPDLSDMTSDVALDLEFKDKLDRFTDQVRDGVSGGAPVQSGNLGWAHPFGIAYGGMTGGERIEQVPGVSIAWSGSTNGYRFTELRSRMITERQPYALMSSKGVPTRFEDHAVQQEDDAPWLPFGMFMIFFGNDSYFGFNSSPTFQSDFVDANGLNPDYEEALRSYRPVDAQHHTRYTADLQRLLWLGNDSVARFQLRQVAELFRMTFHEGYSGNSNYVSGHNMLGQLRRIEQHPNTGIGVGRAEGWGFQAMAAAYAAGSDDFRGRMIPWFNDLVSCVRDGQSACTGNIMSTRINNFAQGKYFTRQSYEMSFVVNGLESIRSSVYEGTDMESVETDLRNTIINACYATIRAPFWDDDFGGLRNVMGVGTSDFSVPDFCLNPPADADYGTTTVAHETTMTVWTYAFDLTEDPEFLQKAAQAIGQTTNIEAEINQMGPSRLAHSALMLGLMQRLASN